jgi:predicted Zn-dependent peptidase
MVEKICLVELPQAKDAALFVGNVIFPQGDPNAFAFSVLNQILGGTPYSRLFMNLRETREYAYYAFSQTELFQSCGVFFVQAKVVPEACGLALREISGELDRITGEKVSTFELEQAKSYLIGSFPRQISRLGDLTRRASDLLALSLSEEHWSGFYDTIMLVDADRVFEVAQKYLLPKPVVVIVGSRDVLAESLREISEFEVYDAKGIFLHRVLKGVQE